ncbi:MAG TPA: Asp-tRNA(Asn)/Glu-tRNA(Gln) amidotransferase subunit GatA [Planctomycetota bacterium]|nr:Asp-tRNA(Asn)/Glu-tRNA(Gln) amidotransferase subunit GatA [Planctomycetota bacterium]
MNDLASLSATALRSAAARGEVSVREIVEAHLARIASFDPLLHAFLGVDEAGARAAAGALDAARARGEPAGPLFGVPVALKDNLCVRGWETTCGSRILRGFRPPYEATAVARLRAAGAVLLGRTNLDEFAMGSSTENSAFGPTRNPWDPSRAPGGSSGGSAAAVAARLAALALGSDTGGSIRQPAALCGVVGVKPTYGRVSRYGLVAFGSSLDQIGPLARTVEDAAAALSVIAGRDSNDSTSVADAVPDYLSALGRGVEGLRLGLPREYFPPDLDPEIRGALERCLERLRGLGATVEEISLPHASAAIPTYYIVATSEASSNLARYDGVKYGLREGGDGDLRAMYGRTRGRGFGAEVKRRILLGTFALSSGYYEAYYGRALRARALLRRDFDEAFRRVDLLLAPTSPFPAFRLGEKLDDPIQMYLCDVFTVTANLVGLPAVSVPAGFTRARRDAPELPIGVQVFGRPLAEADCLRAAAAIERACPVADRAPALAADP